MTKFFKAIEKKDFQKITQLLENEEIDIDENLLEMESPQGSPQGSPKSSSRSGAKPKRTTLHCLEYSIGEPDLFIFLLKRGANPLCAITAISKEHAYLETVLVLQGGAGVESPLFPFVAKRLASLRGKEKTKLHRLLLKYDFPVPRDGEWCNQTEEECKANGNEIGALRIAFAKKNFTKC